MKINHFIDPIEYVDKEALDDEKLAYYNNIGQKEIEANKLAVVTMAGRTGDKTSDILDQKVHLC